MLLVCIDGYFLNFSFNGSLSETGLPPTPTFQVDRHYTVRTGQADIILDLRPLSTPVQRQGHNGVLVDLCRNSLLVVLPTTQYDVPHPGGLEQNLSVFLDEIRVESTGAAIWLDGEALVEADLLRQEVVSLRGDVLIDRFSVTCESRSL